MSRERGKDEAEGLRLEMYTFATERLGFHDMGACQDSVWILYRLNRQSCLIIGVFDTRDAAFAYTERNGPIEQAGWVEPRPGQRFWQYQSELFTYFLEQHQMRHGVGEMQDAMVRVGLMTN